MDATTTLRLARLDDLRRQRKAIGGAIDEVYRAIRRKRALLDGLEAARAALAGRYNAERGRFIDEAADPYPADEAEAIRVAAETLAPPPIRARTKLPCLMLCVPGADPVRVEMPADRLDEARAVVEAFRAIGEGPATFGFLDARAFWAAWTHGPGRA